MCVRERERERERERPSASRNLHLRTQAEFLSDEQLTEIQDAFKLFDKKGENQINGNDLVTGTCCRMQCHCPSLVIFPGSNVVASSGRSTAQKVISCVAFGIRADGCQEKRSRHLPCFLLYITTKRFSSSFAHTHSLSLTYTHTRSLSLTLSLSLSVFSISSPFSPSRSLSSPQV